MKLISYICMITSFLVSTSLCSYRRSSSYNYPTGKNAGVKLLMMNPIDWPYITAEWDSLFETPASYMQTFLCKGTNVHLLISFCSYLRTNDIFMEEVCVSPCARARNPVTQFYTTIHMPMQRNQHQ